MNTLAFIYQLPEEDLRGKDVGNHILRLKYLMVKFRYENGAYATEVKSNSQYIKLTSIKDPKCLESMDILLKAGDFLENLELSDEEFEAYKLPLLKKKSRDTSSFLNEKLGTTKDQQQKRDAIISTTLAQVREYGKFLQKNTEKGFFVVEANSECLAQLKSRGFTILQNRRKNV